MVRRLLTWILLVVIFVWGSSSLVLVVPVVVPMILLTRLIVVSVCRARILACICELYLSFVHVGTAADSNSIYEVRFYLQDALGLLDAIEFNKSETFVFPCRRVLQSIC